ncbi:hypothetical protein AC579_2482 [Pseudocercospora musae]|uniref:Uncharacterized protein n=1 Tax=Pseudocercospora musae TaxID=113226 RepID=A0A139IFB4_9PEZI|nr:hypothetical protein AC579_2482 [Pseudocercospora musae]
MKRMKDSDDYITARGANPRTGLISPSVGTRTPCTPDSPGEALKRYSVKQNSPTPAQKERPALGRANEGRKISSASARHRNGRETALQQDHMLGAFPRTQLSDPVKQCQPEAAPSPELRDDQFVVNMPSAREPQPFSYPGYTAEQIDALEHYRRKARRVSSDGYDRRLFHRQSSCKAYADCTCEDQHSTDNTTPLHTRQFIPYNNDDYYQDRTYEDVEPPIIMIRKRANAKPTRITHHNADEAIRVPDNDHKSKKSLMPPSMPKTSPTRDHQYNPSSSEGSLPKHSATLGVNREILQNLKSSTDLAPRSIMPVANVRTGSLAGDQYDPDDKNNVALPSRQPPESSSTTSLISRLPKTPASRIRKVYGIMAAVKTFIFARRLRVIKADVREMRHIEKDIHRSCRLLIRVLSDCKDASRFCIYADEAEELRSLGEKALQYAANCLQTRYSKAPPLLRKSERYGATLKGHRWRTPGHTLRRLDLRDSGSLRQSILEIVLDGLWAHEVLTDGMLDGTDTGGEALIRTATDDQGADDVDKQHLDDDGQDREEPDDEAIEYEELEDEEPEDEELEELIDEVAGDENTDKIDTDDEVLHDGCTEDDNGDDKDLDFVDLPDCTDFFNLANKAFLLCFGDQVSIGPDDLTSCDGFETDPQHTYLDTGINVASHQDIHNRPWQCKMFKMSLHVLLALAHSHSSWFDNQPVYIWNQSITVQRSNNTYRFLDNTGCEELNFEPRINPPVVLLTSLEKAFWQRQHNALAPNYNVDSTRSYTLQSRALLDIVRISIQARNPKKPSYEYPFHTTKMFNTACQALRRIKSNSEEYFSTDENPLRNQAFNPESESRPFPGRDQSMQRQWAILNSLDHLYRCQARDPNRLIWAELVFEYSAGAGLTILPHQGSRGSSVTCGPEERVDLPALDRRQLWREEMLTYTHFALVGVAQLLVGKFEGRSLRLWTGEEIPKTREQEMVKWVGFLDHPDGYQARLIPGVVCGR